MKNKYLWYWQDNTRFFFLSLFLFHFYIHIRHREKWLTNHFSVHCTFLSNVNSVVVCKRWHENISHVLNLARCSYWCHPWQQTCSEIAKHSAAFNRLFFVFFKWLWPSGVCRSRWKHSFCWHCGLVLPNQAQITVQNNRYHITWNLSTTMTININRMCNSNRKQWYIQDIDVPYYFKEKVMRGISINA